MIRKSEGYGSASIEEALRRGTDSASFPNRDPSYPGSQLTRQKVQYMEAKHDEKQAILTAQVIQSFWAREGQNTTARVSVFEPIMEPVE